MKKIFTRIAIAGVGLSMAIAGAIGAKSVFAKSSSVEAATVTNGTLLVKLGNTGKWGQSSAKLCAYLTDDTNSYWTSPLQTISTSQSFYSLDYSVTFTPTKLIYVRMNPSETEGSWGDGKKWNQTGDLAFKEYTYVPDAWDPAADDCYQRDLTATVRSSASSFDVKTTLKTFGGNTSGHPEVSGTVTLAKNEEFKVVANDGTWSGYWGAPAVFENCFSGGSKTGVDDKDPNIKCEVAGTYHFYFDTDDNKLWITKDNENDVAEASDWASYFLDKTGAICGTGSVDDNHSSALAAIWADAATSNTAYELMGSFNTWTPGSYLKKVDDTHYHYSAIKLAENDEFKVRTSGTWDKDSWPSSNWKVASEQAGWHSIKLNTASGLELGDAFLKESYALLSANAKAVFASGSDNPTLIDALARYTHICSRYGSLDNFANISLSASNVVNVTVTPDTNASAIAIFAVIIGLSIFTVSALYIARKKKMSK